MAFTDDHSLAQRCRGAGAVHPIKDAGADYLLSVKAKQPTLRGEIESAFATATKIDMFFDVDKGHGRIEQRSVSVITEVDWLNGERRFPGELRLPQAATIIRAQSRAELFDPT